MVQALRGIPVPVGVLQFNISLEASPGPLSEESALLSSAVAVEDSLSVGELLAEAVLEVSAFDPVSLLLGMCAAPCYLLAGGSLESSSYTDDFDGDSLVNQALQSRHMTRARIAIVKYYSLMADASATTFPGGTIVSVRQLGGLAVGKVLRAGYNDFDDQCRVQFLSCDMWVPLWACVALDPDCQLFARWSEPG
jgi:hypothetical protein